MIDTTIETFLTASTQDRLRLALDDKYAASLKAYMGEAAFAEYMKLAQQTLPKLEEQHLGPKAPTNLLFIPGAMGSLLRSQTRGGVWWIDFPRMAQYLNRLRLAPDGQTDFDPNDQIVPFTIDVTYEPFLSSVLERDDFGHDTFPYDWRKSLTLSTARLRDKVLQLYETNGHEPIHLVAHSMGGLLVRATLMQYGDELWPHLGRIVFIATPHYGSPMIASYLKNHLWGLDMMGALGLFISRETFRSLWGVLSLLPAPCGMYPGTREGESWRSDNPQDTYIHPCVNFDLYNATSWGLDLSPEAATQLQAVLNGAVSFHQQMYQAHRKLAQDLRDRMAVIVGVGQQTLFRLAYRQDFFGMWKHMDKVTVRVPGDSQREGDGSVPQASATLEYVGETRYVKGVHAGLPALSEVYEDVFRWLNEKPMQLPDTPAQALSQHLGATLDDYPNLTGAARGTAASDAGYWDFTDPDPTHMAALQKQIDADQIPAMPELNKVRLL